MGTPLIGRKAFGNLLESQIKNENMDRRASQGMSISVRRKLQFSLFICG